MRAAFGCAALVAACCIALVSGAGKINESPKQEDE